jgi:hypothetical protein
MAIGYTRTFTHREWIDNVDRVQAGGDNGFNDRFHALEAEFDAIQAGFKQAGDAIDALSEKPPPREVSTTLTPVLVPTGTPWEAFAGGATKQAGATDANGMLSVSLADDELITAFRATGIKRSGNLFLVLQRQSLTQGSNPETIAAISPPGSGSGFDLTATVAAGAPARVDNGQFRYFITADLDSAGANDPVTLTAFQIRHKAG